jgi:hypothetical protein
MFFRKKTFFKNGFELYNQKAQKIHFIVSNYVSNIIYKNTKQISL